MRRSVISALGLVLLLSAARCSKSGTPLIGEGSGAGTDGGGMLGAGVDSGAGIDGSADAGIDGGAGIDGSADAGIDSGAGIDGSTDAGGDGAIVDASVADAPTEAGVDGGFSNVCALPGSRQYTANGVVVVPGGAASPDLSFLTLPNGYCAHFFGTVGNARQIRFAPGGELFVASPTTSTTGGGGGGESAIVVLPDDNFDGVADTPTTFLGALPSTQGIAFNPGYFYYQDAAKIMRVPYATGDRTPSGASEMVADFTAYSSTLHWPKAIDIADDGTVFFTNGGDQGEACVVPHPFHGGILAAVAGGGTEIAQGLRNPIALRCASGHDKCFALELGPDNSGAIGGRSKLVPIRTGDDWGFPCCATTNVPLPPSSTDCSGVAQENVSFAIGETPFGLDFAPSSWPAGVAGSAFVTFHGASGTWVGARIGTVAMDPGTGLPLTSSDIIDGGATGGLAKFATGWDDGTLSHGRPAAVAFSADGRLFVTNDNNGVIFWVAPIQP